LNADILCQVFQSQLGALSLTHVQKNPLILLNSSEESQVATASLSLFSRAESVPGSAVLWLRMNSPDILLSLQEWNDIADFIKVFGLNYLKSTPEFEAVRLGDRLMQVPRQVTAAQGTFKISLDMALIQPRVRLPVSSTSAYAILIESSLIAIDGHSLYDLDGEGYSHRLSLTLNRACALPCTIESAFEAASPMIDAELGVGVPIVSELNCSSLIVLEVLS
jgi:hypothetical protein